MTPQPKRDERRRDTRMRFEQWAHNPTCQANTISAVHNVRMAEVAKRKGTSHLRPVAVRHRARRQLRAHAVRQGAKILLEALIEHECCRPMPALRRPAHSGKRRPVPTLDRRSRRPPSWSRTWPTPPAAWASCRRSWPGRRCDPARRHVAGGDPDPRCAGDPYRRRSPRLIVGEIKTYPDRGGHTDSRELRWRGPRQASTCALRLVAGERGVADRLRIAPAGSGVHQAGLELAGGARRRGSALPGRARAPRFELLERAAALLPTVGAGVVDQDALVHAVMQAESNYCEACLAFCDRAEKCYRDALGRGDPIVLGEDVWRFLGKTDLRARRSCWTGTAGERRRGGPRAPHSRQRLDGATMNSREVVRASAPTTRQAAALQPDDPLPCRRRCQPAHRGIRAHGRRVAAVGRGVRARGKKPTVLTVPRPQPRSGRRDDGAVRAGASSTFGVEVRPASAHTAAAIGALRQLWLPNPTHLEMLHHLAYAYTFTKWGGAMRATLNALGRACGWLFREAQRPENSMRWSRPTPCAARTPFPPRTPARTPWVPPGLADDARHSRQTYRCGDGRGSLPSRPA
jgi:hypothetical protein